jgi:hypothetical protein
MFNNLPKDVLAYMSPDDVARMVADLRAEADRLEGWSKQRSHWQEPEPRWPIAPQPRSIEDYGRVRTR